MKKKVKKEEQEKQLDLGIKEPFGNKVAKVKGNIKKTFIQFEVRKFLKDPFLWATLSICAVLLTQQIILIRETFADLPILLPIFRYHISIPKKLVAKEFLFVFPFISATVLSASFFLTSTYYNKEKVLVKFLLFVSILCVLAQSLILIHLTNSF